MREVHKANLSRACYCSLLVKTVEMLLMAGARVTLDNFWTRNRFSERQKIFTPMKLRCRSSRNLSRLTYVSSPDEVRSAVSITGRHVGLLALVATKAGCNLSRVQVTRRSLIEEH